MASPGQERAASALAGHGRSLAVCALVVWGGPPAAPPSTAAGPLREAIVYTRSSPSNWDVYLFDRGDSSPRRVTDHPALDYNAVFSPDGRWLVFTSERTGDAELYALDVEGRTGPRRLTRNPAMDDAAGFSPDGTRLVFVSTRDGDADIFVMPFAPESDAGDARAVNLTRRPGGDFNPAFSPDGRSIAFSRQPHSWHAGDVCWHVELCVMGADGSGVRAFDSPGGVPPGEPYAEEAAGSPGWSADGKAIYYSYVYRYYPVAGDVRDVVGGDEVRRVRLDGSGDVAVVGRAYAPAAAGAGRVGFVRPDDDDAPPAYSSGQIFTVASDGSDPRQESHAVEHCYAPDFHGASGRMACHGPGPDLGGPGLPHGHAFVMPGTHRSVTLPDRTVVLRGTGAYFPALTPDGRVLSTLRVRSAREVAREPYRGPAVVPLLLSAIDGTGVRELFRPPAGIAWGPVVARGAGWAAVAVGPTFGDATTDVDLWKVPLDGAAAVELTAGSAANDAFPGVSADGRRVVFRSGRDGPRSEGSDPPADMAVYVMDGDGGNVRRLSAGFARETMPAMSPDGEWVVYVAWRGAVAELWISRSDGSERRLLEPERDGVPGLSLHPRFSPDGEWVVFTSDRGGMNDEWPFGRGPQPYGDLWAVPVEGGPAVRLTSDKWEDGPSDWGFLDLSVEEEAAWR